MTLTATAKPERSFEVSWAVLPQVPVNKLQLDLDGTGTFSDIPASEIEVTGQQRTHRQGTQSLVDAINRTYRVSACETVACDPALATSTLPLTSLADAIPVLSWTSTATGSAHRGLALADSVMMNGQAFRVLAVGAPLGAGAVNIFVRRADLSAGWQRQALGAPVAQEGFGHSVALSSSGSWLAVGAPRADRGAGAVYLYSLNRTTGLWVAHSVLKAPNAEAGDAFGTALAFEGDGGALLIGAPFEDGAAQGIFPAGDLATADVAVTEDAGAVYRMVPGGAGPWTLHSYLKPISPAGGVSTLEARFGAALSISGDARTMAVGAPGASWGALYSGAVQTFTKPQQAWTHELIFFSEQAAARHLRQRLGSSVAVSFDGLTLAVGDPESSAGGAEASGSAHVYVRGAGTWVHQQSVAERHPKAFTRFGYSVALGGNSDRLDLLVGALEDDSGMPGLQRPSEVEADFNPGSQRGAGAAYQFRRKTGDTQWALRARLKAPAPSRNAFLGTSVAIGANGRLSVLAGQGVDALYLY